MQTTRVIFLGTGDAFSAEGRHQAAYLIEAPETTLLLDCGSTTLASLKRYSLPAEPIDTIFLSHLHGDHFAGLPFLFLQYAYLEPRSRPLRIIGPPEVEGRVRMLFKATYADTATEPLPYSLEFIEMRQGRQFCYKGVRINPFPVPHQEHPASFGCEIEVGGRKIVYSGDAGWTEELVAHAQNADLFLCECSYFETRMATHLDYPRIAENLGRFGAKRVVLTHLGQEVLERQQEIEMEMAHDGQVVTL
jgi:ribonuclease BN (tRNA processing enzyme)